MKYNIRKEISNKTLNLRGLTESLLIRESLHEVVDELPMKVLKKMFNINITTPTENNIHNAILKGDDYEYRRLLYLDSRDISLIEGEFYVKED